MKDDEPIQRALARRAELELEIQNIDIFIAMSKKFSGAQPPRPGSSEDGSAAPVNSSKLQAPEPARRGRYIAISQADFATLIRSILLECGSPMGSQSILNAMHSMGRRLGGNDELRNLTTKLWRAQEEITKIPGAGYWPVDVPCPAASYMPKRPASHGLSPASREPVTGASLISAPLADPSTRWTAAETAQPMPGIISEAVSKREPSNKIDDFDEEIPF